MKKFTFLSFAMLLCLFTLATKANAQVNSMADLFGKYRFTATFDFTPAPEGVNTDIFKNDCEVVISAGSSIYYLAEVSGLMGADYEQSISDFSAADNTFTCINPNPNYGLWNGYIGVTDTSLEDLNSYNMVYKYNPETKEITIDDFQIAAFSWPAPDYNMTATVYANVTNAKLTLIEAENETVEIPSIAGDWDYEPVDGYVRNDSTFASTFSMSLVATDETNKAYDATITYGDFEPFTLSATFDGSMLTIPYDSVFLVDGENEYFFASASPATKKDGAFTFQYQNETTLMQWDYIYIRQDSVWVETEVTDEETGNVTVEGIWGFPIVQRLNWGYATRESEAVKGFSWAGTFNVSAKDVIFADEDFAATFGEWPSEFQIVIEELTPGSFYMTEFMGRDTYTTNGGSCVVTPAADNKSASLSLTQYYDMFLLESLGNGEYLQMFDGMGEATSLNFTLNDDGTLTIDPFFIQKTAFGADPSTFLPVVMYQDITAERYVEPFDWASGYFLTADVEVFDTTREWPEEFVVKIEYNEGWGLYLLTEFFNYDNVTSLCYGANSLTIAEDTQSATYNTGSYVGGKYPLYINIYDKSEGTTALNFTVNEDGTVSMDDFILYSTDYEGGGAAVKGALYTNVVLTKGDTTGIDSIVEEIAPAVEGIFDLMGRKYDEITAPGIYIVNGKKVVVK